MNIGKVAKFICLALILSAVPAAAEDFTNAIHAFLQHRGDLEKAEGGIVVGLLDEHGSRIISYGKLDNGTDQEVNGDTVFNLYSWSCRFTGLLLEDMIERGEMKLDDPVAMYLPKTVKMPTYHGKEITLRHLLAESSGLPFATDCLDYYEPKDGDNVFADFTVEMLYDFVSNYQLPCAPGSVHQHGSVDMGLLAQAIALKAGTNYESLLADWICRPLKMESTQGALTPELKTRYAAAHFCRSGYGAPPEEMGVLTRMALR